MEDSTNEVLRELRAENAKLRKRIDELEAQISFLGQHKALAAGMKGERLTSQMTGGKLTLHTAPVDVITAEGVRIEVKYARKTIPVPKYPNHVRWQWQKVFGDTGKKDYDFLLLIGEADEKFKKSYLDASSPFVMFCLSQAEARSVMTKGTRGANGIMLSCNPTNARGLASRLFRDNQITTADLVERFGSTALADLSGFGAE